MGLAERLIHSDTPRVYTSADDIPVHEFTAAVELYWLDEASRNNIKNLFSLDTSASNNLDTLLDELDSLAVSGVDEQGKWMRKLNACAVFYQNGNLSKSQWKSIMGL